MVRVYWRYEALPPDLVAEAELVDRIERMVATEFMDSPLGPVSVEILDDTSRVLWQGHYSSAARLADLLPVLRCEDANLGRPPA